jgi:hypothetical protein
MVIIEYSNIHNGNFYNLKVKVNKYLYRPRKALWVAGG